MKQMTIENLMSSDSINFCPKNEISIGTIFKNSKIGHQEIKFNLNSIIKRREKKRLELRDKFISALNHCFTKIKDADGSNITDIFYELPISFFNDTDENSLEIIRYITDNLRREGFDVLIINNTTLFITWKYIEANRK